MQVKLASRSFIKIVDNKGLQTNHWGTPDRIGAIQKFVH